MDVKKYLKEIKNKFSEGDATEHTHRSALQELIQSVDPTISLTNEPKRVKCGAPDFVVKKNGLAIGYIETKDLDINLDNEEESEQLLRYRSALSNLILTNYLEFRWYAEGELQLKINIADLSKNGKVSEFKNEFEKLNELTKAFVNQETREITSTEDLSEKLALLARQIKFSVTEALSELDGNSTLQIQLDSFKQVLFGEMSNEQFSDMYSQTICYGLFAAKFHSTRNEFSRESAAYELPKTNPFLRKLFGHLAGPDLDERITWAVDELVKVLNCVDIEEIKNAFAERAGFEDPVVHFYETFLAKYDSAMRKARGVYYTPQPVVDYIVRSVDLALSKYFDSEMGLADFSETEIENPETKEKIKTHKVILLDPATGTGTFLKQVINVIKEKLRDQQGIWSDYVSKHLLPRTYGFEVLMAPYAISHLKLGILLAESGYDFESEERLRVFLTNTLDEPPENPGLFPFARWLLEEASAVKEVKKKFPVMVVLGNPPYAVSSQNKSEWISNLLKDYKEGLSEKKINLDDDFIKFIRFSQWRIEQTGYGIFAMITNNTFLDGVTHRRMRESLLKTFDELYILNLHGSSKRKETPPDGVANENVFDIQQGVSISIFIRKEVQAEENQYGKVFYADNWGTREEKYNYLSENSFATTEWIELEPKEDRFYFVPKNDEGIEVYGEFTPLTEAFNEFGNGIGTDRDGLFYDFEKEILKRRIKKLFSENGIKAPFKDTYKVKNSSSYKLLDRRSRCEFSTSHVHECLYRPFDKRWVYYDPELTSRPAYGVMQHMLEPNQAILTTRQISSEKYQHAMASNTIIDRDPISLATRERTQIFPLYTYHNNEQLSFIEKDSVQQVNLSSSFIIKLQIGTGLTYIPGGSGNGIMNENDIFNYIYAIISSENYRRTFNEFLKTDFPSIPTSIDGKYFKKIGAFGDDLFKLFTGSGVSKIDSTFPEGGSNKIEKIDYQPVGSNKGKIWINDNQYFGKIHRDVWNFEIGGYQVLEKWLKDRKSRKLTSDEIFHYHSIVSSIGRIQKLTEKLDGYIVSIGGWENFVYNQETSTESNIPQSTKFEKILKRRLGLASSIVNNLQGDVNFGRTKFAKVFFLAEHMLDQNLETDYYREANGPLDQRLIYNKKVGIESLAKKYNLFSTIETENKKIMYSPLNNLEQTSESFLEDLGESEAKKLNEIVDILRPLSTTHTEVVSTIYAIWNDQIQSGVKKVDVAKILKEYNTKWHPKKEKVTKKIVEQTIAWMKKKKLEPKGNGKRTHTK